MTPQFPTAQHARAKQLGEELLARVNARITGVAEQGHEKRGTTVCDLPHDTARLLHDYLTDYGYNSYVITSTIEQAEANLRNVIIQW